MYVTPGWPTAIPGQSEVPQLLSYSWDVQSTHHHHSRNCFQGHRLEREMYCENIWTNYEIETSKALYTSELQDSGLEMYVSCSHLRQALYKTYKTSLAYLTCPLSIWSALSLSLVSLCPPFTEVNFRFHLGNFRGFKSTIYDSGGQSIVFKSRCNCP